MAVKFSEFTQKSNITEVTEIVGYYASSDLNVRIVPSALDTTYAYSTTSGASPALTLVGTKAGVSTTTEQVTLSGLGGTILAGTGTNAISFTSTTYSLIATDTSPAGTVPLILRGSGGGDAGDDIVNLVGAGGIGITSSSNTITITGSGGGGGGGVTSVGLTETGSALTITGSPITSSGTFNIAGAGTSSQVILGNLTLATLPTDTNTTYTVDVPTGTTSINLKGSDATDDAIVLVGGTDIGLVRDSANQITINSQAVGGVTSVDETTPGTSSGTPIVVNPTTGTVLVQSMAYDGQGNVGHVPAGGTAGQYLDGAAGDWITLPAGDTYTLQAGAKAGTSVPIQLDAAAGADSTVSLTEGTGITLTQTSATEITIASAAGISRLVTTDTGDGTTLIFTDITGSLTLPASNPEFNIDIYISGVYQAKASYTYTTATNGTITFASGGAPPNGAAIEYVTTT